MDKYSTLVLITDAFPFCGPTEKAFVIPELKMLSESFSEVIIMPTTSVGAPTDIDLPENIEISTEWLSYKPWKYKLLRSPRLLHPTSLKSFFKNEQSLKQRFSSTTYSVAALTFRNFIKGLIRKRKLDAKKTLFYTFWFDFTTSGLSLLRDKNLQINYISRAHRFDILTDRATDLRRQTVENSLRIFAVSRRGKQILCQKLNLPEDTTKIEVATLGSIKLFDDSSPRNPNRDKQITFLSASRTVDIKRVDLNFALIRQLALARPALNVRWIHIGDGPETANIRHIVETQSPANLSVEFRGSIDNRMVHEIYKSEPIDWFILLSTNEGLPISVCEAMSYSVPVVATAVDGTDEIVDDDNGLPLPANPRPEEFVLGILPYIDSPTRYEQLRAGAFNTWLTRFDASSLRPLFIQQISQL